jgi:uncharacterized protein (TIGR03792 family)
MVVELLHFVVAPGRRDDFIARNEELWTPALRQQPGFLGREILVNVDRPDEVVIVIHWRTLADLETFPAGQQEKLEARMADVVRSQVQRTYDLVAGGPAI